MTRNNDNLDAFETQVESALAGLAPAATLEDRLLVNFRRRAGRFEWKGLTMGTRLLPQSAMLRRSAIGVAATLAVAAIGYLGMSALDPSLAPRIGGRDDLVVVRAPQSAALREQAGAFAGVLINDLETRNKADRDWYYVADQPTRQKTTVGREVTELTTARGQRRIEPGFVAGAFPGAVPAESNGKDPSLASGEAILGKRVEPFFETAKFGYAVQNAPADSDDAPGQTATPADVKLSLADESKASAAGPVATPALRQAVEGRPVLVAGQAAEPRQPESQTTQQVAPAEARKIIRTGNVEFEVQSFDSGFATLSKIVAEEGGMIGSTESSKLENGKTRGTIVVRVPPENLDRLVTKLRGLGELKTQNISAADVTKHYTDLESQLRAANAMQDRLIQIIKEGKGAIKDLLAAEKELGNWRTKIEQLEGERRYIDSQVALSTLSITLTETNIAQAATLTRTENVNAGIECDDVETARAALLAAIDELGGRVISAELKQLDAGQFNASVVAEVKAETSGQLIDRLKQLGRVARLTAERSEKSSDGSSPATTITAHQPKIETRPATFQVNLYNLANIAPRLTQTITLASADVEAAYRALLEEANKVGGRVVASEMQHPRPNVVSATLRIDVPAAQAEALHAKLKTLGIVISSSDSQSTDTTNVTTTKRGFSLTLIDVATVPPRETVNASVRVDATGNALATLLAGVQNAGGKVITQSQSRDASGQDSATVSVDVPMSASATLLQALQSLGRVDSIRTNQNADVPAGELARARFEIALATTDAIAPRDGFWNSIKSGLSISFRGLAWSVQLIVVGLCLVAPWVFLIWLGMKLRKRLKSSRSVSPV